MEAAFYRPVGLTIAAGAVLVTSARGWLFVTLYPSAGPWGRLSLDAGAALYVLGLGVWIRAWFARGDAQRRDQALHDSERRYGSLIDNSPLGIYRSALDGHFLAANAALVQMLGYES